MNTPLEVLCMSSQGFPRSQGGMPHLTRSCVAATHTGLRKQALPRWRTEHGITGPYTVPYHTEAELRAAIFPPVTVRP